MTFKIAYKFTDDKKSYTCYMTYEQYQNFKELPVVNECTIIKKNQQNIKNYYEEMQKALDLAVQNNTSHIRKLSESV